jgi:hypothetical protein
MPPRRFKCSYRERGRRCPRDGTGNPPLCSAHRIAFAEAARPKRPTEVIAEALLNFMQGEPVNAGATVSAFDQLFRQGIGTNYHPDLRPGGPWDWGTQNAPPFPPPPDPRAEARRAELDARQVMGFAPREPLTQDQIKDRKKTLARRVHPDRPGGSHEKMRAVNAAADVLLASL